jgi:hypothetical protein
MLSLSYRDIASYYQATEIRNDYEEIIAKLRELQASDFDYNNADARGWESLAELTAALMNSGNAEKQSLNCFTSWSAFQTPTLAHLWLAAIAVGPYAGEVARL